MPVAPRPRGFGNFNMAGRRRDDRQEGQGQDQDQSRAQPSSAQEVAPSASSTTTTSNFRPPTRAIWDNAVPRINRAPIERPVPTTSASASRLSDTQPQPLSWNVWNPEPNHTRSTSSSASPSRPRDAMSTQSFYDTTIGSLGQNGGYANGRPRSYLDPAPLEITDYGHPYGAMRIDPGQRASQDGPFSDMAAIGGHAPSSRDGSRHSNESQHSPPPGFGPQHASSNSIASMARQPIANPTAFSHQTSSSRSYLPSNARVGSEPTDLSGQFNLLGLNDGGRSSSRGSGSDRISPPYGRLDYPTAVAAPTMALSPQPWLGATIGAYNAPGADAYAGVQTSQYLSSTRRSSAERFIASTAANSAPVAPVAPVAPTGLNGQYRNMVDPAPRHFSPHIQDPWGQRPPSRDHRASGPERRTPVPPFMQPQAQSFYPGGYYNSSIPSLTAHFEPNIYDTFARAPPGVLHPTFTLPLNYPHGLAGPVHVPPHRAKDRGAGGGSPLLEEFRSSSRLNKKFELRDIYHHVVEFSGDQHGSRFIQQKLETANSDEKGQVFDEIEPNAVQLMKDVFGNYVIQKFFEHGNQAQKRALAEKMTGKVVDLSMQMYACRVVQKALEHVLVEQQKELVRELRADIDKVIKDQNGNHVVQKVIELLPRKSIGFIMDAFTDNVREISTHPYGCRVAQRMLEHGSPKDKAAIIAELHVSAETLVLDQYGNYVVQHIIEKGKVEDSRRMIQFVTSQLIRFAKHKFASNVVETCIKCGTKQEILAIRNRLMTAVSDDGQLRLPELMTDPFANYVLQKMLNDLEGADREALVEELEYHFGPMQERNSNRTFATAERLIKAARSSTPNKPNRVRHRSSQQSSGSAAGAASNGSLHIGGSGDSVAPTPVLTSAQNSPQSSGPPSTNASAVGESVEECEKPQLSAGPVGGIQVQDDDDES